MGSKHVAPHNPSGWQVTDGSTKAGPAVHETQDEAIDHARTLLEQDSGGELVIHGQDGQIRDKRTISRDGGPANSSA